MPIVQNGKYFNVKLDQGEKITLTKQYKGAGNVSANGSVRYSFIDSEGRSAAFFATPELSMQIATVPVGEPIVLAKEDDPFGKISATLTDGAPLFAAPAQPAQTAAPVTNTAPVPTLLPTTPVAPVIQLTGKDITIAWQNANNVAAVMAAQVAGGIGEKMDAFKMAQETVFENFLGEFSPESLKSRKLAKEAGTMFDAD